MKQKRKQRRSRQMQFETWMIEAAKQHCNEGWSFSSFSGKYNIPNNLWFQWAAIIPELDAIRREYNLKKNNRKWMTPQGRKYEIFDA